MSAEEMRSAWPKWAGILWIVMAVVMGVQSVVLLRLWQERPRERPAHRYERVSKNNPASHRGSSDAASAQPQAGAPKGLRPFADLDELWRDFDTGSWDPLDEMKRMRERMDSLFDDSFGRFSLSPGAGSMSGGRHSEFSPKLDLQEKDDCYVASMDIPGANKNDISVKLEDRVLTVAGRVQETVEQKDRDQVLRKERRSGRFERTLTLPGPVLPDKMDARYENGVLAVTIPKAKEVDKQTKTIPVK
jgi:HSP20 family protein